AGRASPASPPTPRGQRAAPCTVIQQQRPAQRHDSLHILQHEVGGGCLRLGGRNTGSTALSIRCFECNSVKDPYCQDLKANESASQAYLKDCKDTNMPQGAEPFCRKIVQT
ncbi:hypothetical protein FOCC_FOCC017953, partial [Frankliniella occidentalis]